RPPVHAADEAEESPGVREVAQDVSPLVVQGRAADLDQAGVVGPAVQAQLTQPGCIERPRRLGVVGAVALTEAPQGRVFGQVHDAASFIAYANIVQKNQVGKPDWRDAKTQASSRGVLAVTCSETLGKRLRPARFANLEKNTGHSRF